MTLVATVTPATRRSLTTVSRFRDAGPDVEIGDEELEQLIARCSAFAERYCGRVFARERVIEEWTGNGLMVLLLARTPVITIHELAVGGTATALYNITSYETGMVRMANSLAHDWLWREMGMPELYDRPSTRADTLYRVEYTGGYLLPDDTGGAVTLPADLEHACMILVRGEIEARERSVGLSSERLGDAAWTYAAVPGMLGMGHAKPILDHYKVPVI